MLVYPELCHACGGCLLVCGPGAIREVLRESGKLEIGQAGPVRFIHGVLRIGEAMSTHLIHQVKQAAPETDLVIIDSPPGTSCPVIESVRGADFVLLVTEPTPFGLNDLKLAVEMVRAMKLPLGVVINRAGSGDDQTSAYCHTQGIDILSEIPDDRRVAEAYSRGVLASEAMPEIQARFESLLRRLMGEALFFGRSAGGLRMSELIGINTQTGRPVQELAVISGKGGTGKTSIVASFAALSRNFRAGRLRRGRRGPAPGSRSPHSPPERVHGRQARQDQTRPLHRLRQVRRTVPVRRDLLRRSGQRHRGEDVSRGPGRPARVAVSARGSAPRTPSSSARW